MRTYISIVLLLGCVAGTVQAQAPTDRETCLKAAKTLAAKLTQDQPEYKFYPEANYNLADARCYVGIQKYGPHGADGKYKDPRTEELILYDGQTGTELAKTIRILTRRTVGDVAYDVEQTGTISGPATSADHEYKDKLRIRSSPPWNQPVLKHEKDWADYTDAFEYIGNKLRAK